MFNNISNIDVECISENGTFPQANRDGDKVTQIGIIFSDKDECRQHIIKLGRCDPIPNVTIENYNTEQEVLLAWYRLQTSNFDILTNNAHDFGLEYIKDRSKKLGICVL